MALRVEERHEKLIEDVKYLKMNAPKTEGETESKEVGTENTHGQLSLDLFKFKRTIARGTFGEVKEYTSIRTGGSFAIKVSSASLESENIASPLLGTEKVTCS